MITFQQRKNKDYNRTFLSEYIEKIKNLFSLIIIKQNENSILKNKLFAFKAFSPEIFFLKLDYFSKNNVTTLDILYYLEQHQYKFNDEIIRRFIKQFDRHGNFNLIYEDFLNIILPWDKGYNLNDQYTYEGNGDLEISNNEDLDELFCQILINELKLIGSIGDEIISIRRLKGFDSYKIFEIICNKEKYLTGEMLFIFLEGKFNTLEIKRLVYFLDRNNDGLISFDDFHDLLIPIKGDFEDVSNNKFIFYNDYAEQIDFPIYNNIYTNSVESNENNNSENINSEIYGYDRKTYFINYNDKTRNIINNSNMKNKIDLINIQNDKKSLTNKYIDDRDTIHVQN